MSSSSSSSIDLCQFCSIQFDEEENEEDKIQHRILECGQTIKKSKKCNSDFRLSVVQFNVGGLRKRREALERFLNGRDDVIVSLNGTRYTGEDDTDEDSDDDGDDSDDSDESESPGFESIPGYELYKDDFDEEITGLAGGVAFLVPENFKVKKTTKDRGLDNLRIVVSLPCGHRLNLMSYYNHPRSGEAGLPSIREINENAIRKFFYKKPTPGRHRSKGATVNLLVGDLNANHEMFGSSKTDTTGRDLVEILDDQNLCCLNDGTPTRGKNVLDFAITDRNSVRHVASCRVLRHMKDKKNQKSDHRPLEIQLVF